MTNNTSLFIPHIFSNISEERIKSVIENTAKYGKVDQIDFVPKKSADGKSYNSAYIHFKSWNNNEKTKKFLADLKNKDTQTHIVYDKPWFWIVLENTSCERKKEKNQTQTQTPPNSPNLNEFPPLMVYQTPIEDDWSNLRITPCAPTKNTNALDIRDLNQEFDDEMFEAFLNDEAAATMDLVDADYVYHLEQDNTQLRNNNDWFQQQNYILQQEIERLRTIMHGIVSGGGMM
jgi:hypothetical protein